MKDNHWYVKPKLVSEPLFDRWYARSHLISPATAAMNVVGRHLKVMSSYIQARQIHASALQNPQMLGSPFMDYEVPRVEDITELIET